KVTIMQPAARTPITTTPIDVPMSSLKWKWSGLSSHSSARRGNLSRLLFLEMPETSAAVGEGIFWKIATSNSSAISANGPLLFRRDLDSFCDKERERG